MQVKVDDLTRAIVGLFPGHPFIAFAIAEHKDEKQP
jgi:hypothetical protein